MSMSTALPQLTEEKRAKYTRFIRKFRRNNKALLGFAFVLLLLGAAAFIAHSFVGILALGVFGYYATRPICGRFRRIVDSERWAATLTVLVVLLPTLLLVLLAIVRLVRGIQALAERTDAPLLAGQLGQLELLPSTQRARWRDAGSAV